MFQKIKQLRKNQNISQEKLAKILGYKKNAVSQWETGKRTPNHETLVKLAKIFNVSVDYLLGNDNIEQQSQNTIIPDYQQEVIDLVLKLNSRQCSRLCGYIERQFEETTYKTKEN